MNFKYFIESKRAEGFSINKATFRAKIKLLNALRRAEKMVAKDMCRAGFYGYAPGQITKTKLEIWLLEYIRASMYGKGTQVLRFGVSSGVLHPAQFGIDVENDDIWSYFCSMSVKIKPGPFSPSGWAPLVSYRNQKEK